MEPNSTNQSLDDQLKAQAAKYLGLPYARIILPESDGSYRGEIMEFPGCIATGDTAAEALLALEDAAESWIMAALENKQAIPRPLEGDGEFSGKLMVRLPKSLHKKATRISQRDGVSLNQFIMASVAVAVGERQMQHRLVSSVTNYFIQDTQNVYVAGYGSPQSRSLVSGQAYRVTQYA